MHTCTKRYVLLKGSAGSGKSVDTAQQYILRLMRDVGRNLICLRKSEVTNRDSTYAELCAVIHRYRLDDYWKIGTEPLMLQCVNGNSVIFRGMNDDKQREKLKSVTFRRGKLTDVWFEELTEFSRADFELVADEIPLIPLGRIAVPEDVANTVLFLVSEAADYVTGQIVAPNGGKRMLV